MKTIQELYNEVMASEALKEELKEASQKGKVDEFLKQHDCNATTDELMSFLEGMQGEDEDLSFDELELVAGGNTGGDTFSCWMSLG
ncbi:MAG: hypothetical protein IKQ49_08970 [Eubacterium sp.]|nr:hypothetical protein [Eubacterium sp.]